MGLAEFALLRTNEFQVNKATFNLLRLVKMKN